MGHEVIGSLNSTASSWWTDAWNYFPSFSATAVETTTQVVATTVVETAQEVGQDALQVLAQELSQETAHILAQEAAQTLAREAAQTLAREAAQAAALKAALAAAQAAEAVALKAAEETAAQAIEIFTPPPISNLWNLPGMTLDIFKMMADAILQTIQEHPYMCAAAAATVTVGAIAYQKGVFSSYGRSKDLASNQDKKKPSSDSDTESENESESEDEDVKSSPKPGKK